MKLSIFVPKSTNAGVQKPEVLAEAARLLAQAFGGCTIQDCTGIWFAANGQKFEDQNSILFTYVEADQVDQAQAQAQAICAYVKAALEQEAVLWSLEQAQAHFV